MEKKQTAVEWFVEQIKIEEEIDFIPSELIKQAKEMEKKQIVNAHGIKENHGWKNGQSWWEMKTGEEYYNETYNK